VIIILNGPAGVGKTTTARALAGRAMNGACIHGDDLRDFIVTRRDGSVQQGLGYRNGAAVASTFVDGGYGLVVFEYVFESPRGHDHFRSAYVANAPVHFFTLWAPLEVVRLRERTRDGRRPLGDRVTACWHAVQRNLDDLGVVIDTDGRAVDDVVDEILLRTERGEGRLITPLDRPRALTLAS
jgi:predicted kinase